MFNSGAVTSIMIKVNSGGKGFISSYKAQFIIQRSQGRNREAVKGYCFLACSDSCLAVFLTCQRMPARGMILPTVDCVSLYQLPIKMTPTDFLMGYSDLGNPSGKS